MVVGSRTGSRHVSQPNGINIFETVLIVILAIYEILYQNGTEYVKHCPCARPEGLSDHRCLDNRKCGADIDFTLHAKEVVTWKIAKS